ncbi:MAG: DNA methyltransferase [Bacteroidota bacterium]|nr:DNA methyltransferase [Bacteroidota bacterium]
MEFNSTKFLSEIVNNFEQIKSDSSWSFSNDSQSKTRYLTHGYHTYPAKFIPQVAERLIKEYTLPNEVVVDPFMGSGTTIVESMMCERVGVGVDINPVAHLIAKVKSTPNEPFTLKREYVKIETDLETRMNGKANLFATYAREMVPENDRIDYWFTKTQKERLSIILGRIIDVRNNNLRDFFLVAFSQILKSCSIWLQKSVKPTRDLVKIPSEPLDHFLRQARFMIKRNQEFWNSIPEKVKSNLESYRIVSFSDARSLPLEKNKASLIVTSPPYVTSYEYADLHQLTALWLQYCNSVPEFRKQFIGTSFSERSEIDLKSKLANQICLNLGTRKKSKEVKNYFADMLECFEEMKRVLKKGGKACIVIGNTKLQGTPILNAEVFVEQMLNIGFATFKIIKREIPSKILPQTRDPQSGKFTASNGSKSVLAYPVEYIIIMEKL